MPNPQTLVCPPPPLKYFYPTMVCFLSCGAGKL